jgi:hypothetical protein
MTLLIASTASHDSVTPLPAMIWGISRAAGYACRSAETECIIANTIVEKLTPTSAGAFEMLTPESTKPVAIPASFLRSDIASRCCDERQVLGVEQKTSARRGYFAL